MLRNNISDQLYRKGVSGDCEKLLQKLQSLRRVRGIDSAQLKEIVGMIISEKGYITAWRKSDNQRYKEMKKASNPAAEKQ